MKVYKRIIIAISSLLLLANISMVVYVVNEDYFNKEEKTYIVEEEHNDLEDLFEVLGWAFLLTGGK